LLSNEVVLIRSQEDGFLPEILLEVIGAVRKDIEMSVAVFIDLEDGGEVAFVRIHAVPCL
jgi:hypothetical protein